MLGAGPGGYPAAFRAADLGLDVTLVERWPVLGGVCLNVGCIPSKALLHAARVIDEAESMAALRRGVRPPEDRSRRKLRGWKNKVVGKLTGGLASWRSSARSRWCGAWRRFLSAHHLRIAGDGDAKQVISFENCIIAAGSEPVRLPGFPGRSAHHRFHRRAGTRPAETMLVVGGGIIGLEMATVYDALGVRVSVVELTDALMPGTDPRPGAAAAEADREALRAILLGTKVAAIEARADGLHVTFEGKAPGRRSSTAC